MQCTPQSTKDDEHVEEREPGQHEVEPVEAQEETGDDAEGGRAGEAARETAHDQDHQGADDGGRDPPAEGIHAEGRPSAISHLPTSGCTIIDGSSFHYLGLDR